MKKILLSLAIASFSASIFAVPESVECSTSPTFEGNSCEVCYTDTFDAKETESGWTSNITNIKIPWKHGEGEQSEMIYDDDQALPEIKSTLQVSTQPEKPEDLWTSHDELLWQQFSDHREAILKKGEEVGLYKLQNNAGVTVNGFTADDTITIVTPLTVRDFDAVTNVDSNKRTRNICVQGKFVIKAESTTAPVENTVPTTAQVLEEQPKEEVPPLNAAPPEPTKTTPEQTNTETGPGLWIALAAISLVLSSAYSAWKKQQS